MPTKKAVKPKPEKEVKEQVKKEPEVTQEQLDAVWDIIKEIQNNMTFIDTKVERIMKRMGLYEI